jgi:hypothetical protein
MDKRVRPHVCGIKETSVVTIADSLSCGLYTLTCVIAGVQTPCGGGLEYLHRCPASRKRRLKGNTVSDETVMYGYWSSVTGLDL